MYEKTIAALSFGRSKATESAGCAAAHQSQDNAEISPCRRDDKINKRLQNNVKCSKSRRMSD